MPKETENQTSMLGALDSLEDTTVHTKCEDYDVIQKILNSGEHVDTAIAQRLLTVCTDNLEKDMKYVVKNVNIIMSIVQRVENGTLSPPPHILPAAAPILNLLINSATLKRVETLQLMCFETLFAYPDDAFATVVTSHMPKLLKIATCFGNLRTHPSKLVDEVYKIILKALKVLPATEKNTFVRQGLVVWFNTILMNITLINDEESELLLVETLESLTCELLNIDYSGMKEWLTVLESIHNPSRFPQIMKNNLEKGKSTWHRLWIVFIRLLKNQITRNNSTCGSPINSMLPVVETAFKMDVTNRCRAFQCWNVLIDNFSTETNEVYVNKRIKLLIIPLRSNNAKVKETALAKFDTWWHLIRKFNTKVDKFAEVILVPFLNFCFGKHASDKPTFVPGQLSNNVKKKCVEGLVEIIGHVNCDNCVNLPKLNGKLITTKLLVDHWNDWLFSLKTAIKAATNKDIEVPTQQLECLWKSFIMTIAELPENNVRRDIFNELLAVLAQLLQGVCYENNPANIVFNTLIISLFTEPKIKPLLKSKDPSDGPMHIIFSFILHDHMNIFYQSNDFKSIVEKFKVLTHFILNEPTSSSNHMIECLLNDLSMNDKSLMLWTALADTICESSSEVWKHNLCDMVLWPLKEVKSFSHVQYSASVWYSMFTSVYPKMVKTSIEKEISKLLIAQYENTELSSLDFLLYGVIAILKLNFKNDNYPEHKEHFKMLLHLINRVDKYQQIKEMIPVLVDTIVVVLSQLIEDINIKLAEDITLVVKSVWKLMAQTVKSQNVDSNFLIYIENLLKPMKDLFNIEAYATAPLKSIIIDDLTDCLSLFGTQPQLKESILSFLETVLLNSDSLLTSKVSTAIDNIQNSHNFKGNEKTKFTTPETKTVKKTKKKEPSIVKTVVDNGEEFVVVKSNWKFNPRKLTENQKEKLQRKREDIPALYQDLSQSQDEVKLQAWKTDSQDTSTTNSHSKSTSRSANEDISSVLKSMPGSNVVPMIMENIFSENVKKESIDAKSKPENKETNKIQDAANKGTKSPRMALKDRVFRNVRNLIEKSGVQKEGKDANQSSNQIENLCKTPPAKEKLAVTNLTNSAPPKISSDRPSRVKRKPKKFDGIVSFGLKKRRHSSDQSESQDNSPSNVAIINTSTVEEEKQEVPEIVENETALSKEPLPSEDANKLDDIQNVTVTKDDPVPQMKNIEPSLEVETNKTSSDEVVSIADTPLENVDLVTPNSTAAEQEETNVDKTDSDTNANKNVSTPKTTNLKKSTDGKSTTKKSAKKSRIEKELAIDMVEGHPFLKKLENSSEKRITRKNILNSPKTVGRKSLAEKMNKSVSKSATKPEKKSKEKEKPSSNTDNSDTQSESQEKCLNTSDDLPFSEDIIESSQDSTMTTISIKSTKNVLKKVPVVAISDIKKNVLRSSKMSTETQKMLDNSVNQCFTSKEMVEESNADIELSRNKTVEQEKIQIDLTENMDTEPIEDRTENMDTQPFEDKNSSDVIVINDEDEAPIVINSEEVIGTETQEIAEADTQPTDPKDFVEDNVESVLQPDNEENIENADKTTSNDVSISASVETTQDDATKTMSESIALGLLEKENDASSPFKDENQRKQDFLNNTQEISPIKILSPVRDKKSPSPETSSDYVVIKLTSPVQSNGEPFEKCDSPEIFTEEKVSPDKRDQSPPREEITVNNTSPSSSLSLKKNRPQVRSGGRAAQMLGLCVPDRLQQLINTEKPVESEEAKKSTPSTTPARRNLRILYNSVGDNNDNVEEDETSENFLKLKRTLPSADSSPAGPILKRKLADIVDDVTVSPASKRKRVSFHDPPVSTTVSVHKYIEPCGIRSPQSSALKRQERQLRPHANLKSPKRLDTVFKLDTALTKTVESFTDVEPIASSDDTQMSSLEQTPAVEIIKTSELNDTDPICSDLVDCSDPIDNIAADLSSPAMKSLLIKELEEKIKSVGDLAKMTELEVNRLCIKAPKIKVAKKVLADYAAKKAADIQERLNVKTTEVVKDIVPETKVVNVEVQTNNVQSSDVEMQTAEISVSLAQTQTTSVKTCQKSAQTEETGSKSTKALIESCLAERQDFVPQLSETLEESSKKQIANKLPLNVLTDVLLKKMDSSNTRTVLNRLLEHQNGLEVPKNGNKELSFLQDYLCERCDSKDLVLFCSQLLQKVYDKPS